MQPPHRLTTMANVTTADSILHRPGAGGTSLARAVRRLGRERAPRGMGWSIALSLLPGTLLFSIFFLIPLGTVVVTSFARWSFLGLHFIGIHNYGRLVHDPVFWKAVENTALYAGAAVFIQVPLGAIVGIILAQRIRGWRVFRTLLFIPVVISGATYAVMFNAVYDTRYGLLNGVVGFFGLGKHDWLFGLDTALPAVMGTFIFVIGFYMILVMTEITSIPLELFEAAEVDGASRFQRQRYITVPLLRHVVGTCVLLSLLWSLGLFDIVYILTSGGPNNQTLSVAVYAYREYANDQWGYANAIGVFVVVTGFLLIVGTRRLFRIGERDV
jgi:raffinose/stachyose/melibiose transport system permease protein